MAQLDGSLPHAIVLDLMMPVMDGFAFRAQQMQSARLATIPVIVLSAGAGLDGAARTLRPYACFSKPFNLDVVLTTVAEACAATAA